MMFRPSGADLFGRSLSHGLRHGLPIFCRSAAGLTTTQVNLR
jgi:hypothetical protein